MCYVSNVFNTLKLLLNYQIYLAIFSLEPPYIHGVSYQPYMGIELIGHMLIADLHWNKASYVCPMFGAEPLANAMQISCMLNQ